MNRQEAIAAGAKRYFGEVCHKHPDLKGERQTHSRVCVTCSKENLKNWRKENKHHESKINKSWKANNPNRVAALNSRRRALKKLAVPGWFELDKVQMVYDKAKVYGMQVDHIVPLQSDIVCGLHCWANLQLLDKSLNAGKCNHYWPDMP